MADNALPIRKALEAEFSVIMDFYRRHWLDQGVGDQDLAADWRRRTSAFLEEARAERALSAFLATDSSEDEPVGCAFCHLLAEAFPEVRDRYVGPKGYIWGVYVDPRFRGTGTGSSLVSACIDELGRRGCRRVLLHAAPRSRGLYERLGFEPTDELSLGLSWSLLGT